MRFGRSDVTLTFFSYLGPWPYSKLLGSKILLSTNRIPQFWSFLGLDLGPECILTYPAKALQRPRLQSTWSRQEGVNSKEGTSSLLQTLIYDLAPASCNATYSANEPSVYSATRFSVSLSRSRLRDGYVAQILDCWISLTFSQNQILSEIVKQSCLMEDSSHLSKQCVKVAETTA